MISFAAPEALWLALPWLAFVAWFFLRQWRVVRWIDGAVAARFRPLLTRYRGGSLIVHGLLLALTGLLLVTALAGPQIRGEGEVEARGDVVLVMDASASMKAPDGEVDGAPAPRLEQARAIAREVVRALPERRFGMIAFSGVATLHLPLTSDHAAVDEALRVFEEHTFYQNTGSRFGRALDKALLLRQDGEGLQILLLSDGELPQAPEYEDAVNALAAAEVPVHGVAVGGVEGQSRVIYDFRDIIAKKEERGILSRFTTRREDHHLRAIAGRTGGTFRVASASSASEVVAAIGSHRGGRERIPAPQAGRHLDGWLLGLFALLLIADGLYLRPRGWTPAMDFDLDRLGEPAGTDRPRSHSRSRTSLSLLLVLTVGCSGAAWRAYLENEEGISRDRIGDHGIAQTHFERAMTYSRRKALPSHNLARSLLLEGNFSEAHRRFEETLQLDPALASAYYNDGVALYRWGVAALDPEGCRQERSLGLWRQASGRFGEVEGIAGPGADLTPRARANIAFLELRMRQTETQMAERCPSSGGGSGGGGGQAGGSQGGSGQGGGEDGGDAEAPPPAEGSGDPSAGGSGDREPPPPPGSGGAFSADDLASVGQALERIREQRSEEGKFFRRTREEQFSRDQWANPETEIWW